MAVDPVSSPVEVIDQRLYFVDKPNKRRLLVHLLKDPGIVSALVFTFTKHGADRVARELDKAGVEAQAIHGNKSQNARQRALSAFKAGRSACSWRPTSPRAASTSTSFPTSSTTTCPTSPRRMCTASGARRAPGLSGTAISFCSIEEMDELKEIEKLIGKKIPVVEDHPYPMEVFEAPPKQPRPQRPPREQRAAKPKPVRQQPQKQQKPAGRSPRKH